MYVLKFQEREKHKRAIDWLKSNKILCWVINTATLEINLFSKEEIKNLTQHLKNSGLARNDIDISHTREEIEYPEGYGWLERLWDSLDGS